MNNLGVPAGFLPIFTIFWIWMLVDCLKNEPPYGNTRIIWALVIIFAPALGAILYFFVRRPERMGRR